LSSWISVGVILSTDNEDVYIISYLSSPDLLSIYTYYKSGMLPYRFATNVDIEIMSNEEIAEGYRQRWAIEILWKFLKMHLKLDRLMTKNVNGVTIQIYTILIVYLILQLMQIPQIYGDTLLNKLGASHLFNSPCTQSLKASISFQDTIKSGF